jgi:enamine deaminase RidA (YjgF/YER057c/UK114 family)
MAIEQRMRELGLELPVVPTPAANYANAVRTGNLVFLSGTVPVMPDGTIFGERHARSAIGVGSLPFGITVEIEAIFEVD